jgi:hypothetical protein
MTLPKPPLYLYLGILIFAVFILLIAVINLVDTGVLYPSYHCVVCKEGQHGKPNIYGLCDRCSDEIIWRARQDLSFEDPEYLKGKTDGILMKKVKEYLKQ